MASGSFGNGSGQNCRLGMFMVVTELQLTEIKRLAVALN